MLNQSPRLRTFVAGFALVFVLSFASANLAQSGRKGRKSDPVPVATPEPEPSPTPDVSSAKTKPRFTFLVGLDRNDTFSNVPLYAHEGVLRSLIGRLEDSPVVKVGASQSNMGRGEAIKHAKAETEAYVIYLQLGLDSLSNNTQSSGNYDIIIEYSVLAPLTAKQLTYGRTYTQAQRNRGSILNPRTSSIYGDRYLNLAAQEAADKILAYFRSHGPSPPPSRP
jgi:hypothetical protein